MPACTSAVMKDDIHHPLCQREFHRSLAHLLRRRLLSTSASQPAERQGKQQHSSSTSQHTALLGNESEAAVQQAVNELQKVYASMAAAFSAGGLDLDAIAETAAWFDMGECAKLVA